MLVGMAHDRSDEEPEFTSFMQCKGKKVRPVHNCNEQLDDAFQEICCAIREQGIQAVQEDAEVHVVQQKTSDVNDFIVDHQVSQVTNEEDQSNVDDTVSWSINTLHECLQRICERGQEGINSDFTMIPHLHPHAKIAAEWVSEATSEVDVWHIFTDGSAKNDKATWAMVILQEIHMRDSICYARVGYAADEVNDEIGRVDQTAMDAEATAIIAMIEYALANCTRANVAVYCHFDAWTVGFGAMGDGAIPCKRDSVSERQNAARMLMTVLERRAESEAGILYWSPRLCTPGPSVERNG